MIKDYMTEAIKEALIAKEKREVPIGAVIVKNGEIIARAHNLRENNFDASAHAEILAIQKAGKKLQDWRLTGCDLYVILEPCVMCMAAIIQARIRNVYFGAYDKENGVISNQLNIFNISNVHIYGGILEDECNEILKSFFEDLRKSK